MATTVIHKRHECGCVASYMAYGSHTRVGAQGCREYESIMNSMLADKRPQTKEYSAEWRERFDSHFGGVHNLSDEQVERLVW